MKNVVVEAEIWCELDSRKQLKWLKISDKTADVQNQREESWKMSLIKCRDGWKKTEENVEAERRRINWDDAENGWNTEQKAKKLRNEGLWQWMENVRKEM